MCLQKSVYVNNVFPLKKCGGKRNPQGFALLIHIIHRVFHRIREYIPCINCSVMSNAPAIKRAVLDRLGKVPPSARAVSGCARR